MSLDGKKWRYLKAGELIQAGDETDCCVDPWKDWPKWEPVHPKDIGQPAPDPRFVAHRIFRRFVTE